MREINRNQLAAIISKDAKTPGEFLLRFTGAIGISRCELAEKYGSSRAYIDMVMSSTVPLGKQACFKFATILGISPKLLYRLSSDYAMKTYCDEQGFEDFSDEMFESVEFKGFMRLFMTLLKMAYRSGRNKSKYGKTE